jgi:spermidine synthase
MKMKMQKTRPLELNNGMKDSVWVRFSIFTLFFFSGVSGLAYQVVWTRLLTLIFGNTMLAASTVLAAFMAGLAAGSFAAGKYIDRNPRQMVRIYALLEAGIGIFALLFPTLLALVEPIYTTFYQGLSTNILAFNLMRFVICFALILVPTFLMGATLPVLLKRFVRGSQAIGHQVGLLYGLNTAGAVAGALVCGFLFLRVLGMHLTTLVAVAINLTVAAVAWLLGKNDEGKKPVREEQAEPDAPPGSEDIKKSLPPQEYPAPTKLLVLIGIGISGFCALAYEVLWTRMLNLFFHNTVHSFTTMLATFLTGICLGSFIYSKFLSRSRRKVPLFVLIEILIGLIAYVTPFIFSTLYDPLFSKTTGAAVVLKAAVIMIVPTILMGIALPLAIQVCQKGKKHEGDSVGTVYAVNTVGAIFGAFAAGFILVPGLGIHKSVIVVAGLNLLAGTLALLSLVRRRFGWVYGTAFFVTIALLFSGAASPLFKILYQRNQPYSDVLLYKEGKIANVVVYDFYKEGYKDLYLNSIEEASSRLWHVQLFKMLGILPPLVHPQPGNALMIAFGAGMAAGACASQVGALDCAELNPDIHEVANIFSHENLDVINSPKLTMIINDGRNHVLMTPKKYSLIISDATNPITFDSWTLYTKEFYEICKKKLKPGGIFCQWVPIPLPRDSIKVILNTFKSVYPHTSFWSIYGSSQCLMLATPEKLSINYRELSRRFKSIVKDTGLEEYGVDTTEKFLSFFLFGEEKLDEMLEGFDKINTDDLPHAQFHSTLDREGIQNALFLLKYQESIYPYLVDVGEQKDRVKKSLQDYLTISQLLNRGFLTGNRLEFEKALLLISLKKLPADRNVKCMLKHDTLRKEYFLKRVKDYPGEALAHNALGYINLEEGNYPEAIKAFRQAVALEPDFAAAHLNLAKAYIHSSRFHQAVKTLLQVRELNPAGPVVHQVKIALHIIHILRKIGYTSQDPMLYLALGQAYLDNGEFGRAFRVIYSASQRFPGEANILGLLASLYENLELTDNALETYRKLAPLVPGDTGLKQKIDGLSMMQTNVTARQQMMSDKLFLREQIKTHPEVCYEAMELWETFDFDGKISAENLREAARRYEKVIEIDNKHMHAYSDAAIIYEALGQYSKASSLWQQGLAVSPNNPLAENNIKRLELLDRLKSGSPYANEKIEIYNQIGVLYWLNGEFDAAIAYFKKVLEINPQHAPALANLGANSVEVGKYKDAFRYLERALQLNPGMQYSANIKERLHWLRTMVEKGEKND